MTGTPRRAIRAFRGAWQRLRFRAWTARLAFRLRRNGGRLRLDAPHGASFESRPRIRVLMEGDGSGEFELSIGRNVRFEHGVLIEIWGRGTNRLRLGDGTVVRDDARFELRSGTIELGREVDMRSLTLLKSYGRLILGSEVRLGRGVFIQCEESIELGDCAGLAEWVSVIDSDHSPDGSDTPFMEQPLRVEPVRIEANTFVARGSTVLRGAKLGKNSLVGANSVVLRGEYPESHLLAGAPAKAVRKLTGDPA